MKFKALKRPLALLFIYFFCQFVLMQLVFIPLSATHAIEISGSSTKINSNVAIIAMCLVSLLSIIIAACMAVNSLHMLDFKKAFAPTGIPFRWSALLVVTAIIGTFGVWMLCELLALPDMLEDDFRAMMHNPFGVLTGCVIAPIGEEILFRGAIQEWLHRYGVKPFWAIFSSAFIFGAVHMNPVQILDAFLIGVVFGILYWKTRSIILTAIIHILGNSLSTVLALTMPDLTFAGIFGGTVPTVLIMIACISVCVAVYWKFVKLPLDSVN